MKLGHWVSLCTVLAGTTAALGALSRRTAPLADPALAGDPGKLGRAYAEWRAEHEKNGGDRNIVMPLGWSKALSTEHPEGYGEIRLDLAEGKLAAEVTGSNEGALDLWLVANRPGAGKSVLPEEGDRFLRVGALEPRPDGASLALDAQLGAALGDFEIDVAVVTRAGETPRASRLFVGSAPLFQRLYTAARRGPRGEPPPGFHLLDLVIKPAHAAIDAVASLDQLVVEGSRLFFNEKFAGNGRTCGTCHRAENNMTLDAAFISSLPPSDPLFVAEFTPALANDFEKPELMRRLGLILVNPDGFDDLPRKFVVRSVSHLLALKTSIQPSMTPSCGPTHCTPPPIDGTTIPPKHRTGWGGDGATGGGTLREFATGAVAQHFTKRLARQAGVDFRLPTDAELDAIEAFMLFLGRDRDLDLNALTLKVPVATQGKQLFTQKACRVCHLNAGASFVATPGGGVTLDTGVERMPNQPARLLDPALPRDGGFGARANADGSFGTGAFNAPPLVEAADTAPYFHNNSAPTLEAAVKFYGTAAFNQSPGRSFSGSISLTDAEGDAIAAFLRTINSLENIRATGELVDFVRANPEAAKASDLLILAIAEVEDARAVLAAPAGGLSATAAAALLTARDRVYAALSKAPAARGPDLDAAKTQLGLAKGALSQ